MAETVLSNKAFSLVEMMIALLIISISFLALSAVMVSAINVNLENELNDTAVRLTAQTAETLSAIPYENISTCGLTSDPEAPDYNRAYTYDENNECLGSEEKSHKKYPNPEQTINSLQCKFNIKWDAQILNNSTMQLTITTSYFHNAKSHVTQAVIYRSRT